MKIISMTPNPGGGWPGIQEGAHSVPEGYALVPEELDLSLFYAFRGFIHPTFQKTEDTEDRPGCYVLTAYKGDQAGLDAWEQAHPAPDPLEEVREGKLTELSNVCNAAIVAGMNVETARGIEHFSLEETDQINLTTALSAVQQGAEGYPYHADGALCRLFSAAEIQAVAAASVRHKLYHTTLCNHLMTWARRAEQAEEIAAIRYSGDALPADLAANMAVVLHTAVGDDRNG